LERLVAYYALVVLAPARALRGIDADKFTFAAAADFFEQHVYRLFAQYPNPVVRPVIDIGIMDKTSLTIVERSYCPASS
jgi:hypothetical protein